MKLLLVLAVIAVIVFVVFRKQSQKAHKHLSERRSRKGVRQAAASKDQTHFHATRIIPGDNACQAAQDLQDKLFLDSELNTPKLPLPECTHASDCHCKYAHRDDRRSDEDDRRVHTLQTDLYPAEGTDRRHKKGGRRATD